ncbi:hypothetical protein DFH27DRAFT_529292 [Peziza echinospora]|nr:hypothetical protein DFH27DRAFT_529292 [Peziza echinospora]
MACPDVLGRSSLFCAPLPTCFAVHHRNTQPHWFPYEFNARTHDFTVKCMPSANHGQAEEGILPSTTTVLATVPRSGCLLGDSAEHRHGGSSPLTTPNGMRMNDVDEQSTLFSERSPGTVPDQVDPANDSVRPSLTAGCFASPSPSPYGKTAVLNDPAKCPLVNYSNYRAINFKPPAHGFLEDKQH